MTAAIARYGDSAVAGYAVIGRIVPLAFGAIFALSGSIGPILGQNFGAKRFDRVRRTLTDSMIFIAIYCIVMWIALMLLREPSRAHVQRVGRRRGADPFLLHLHRADLAVHRRDVRGECGTFNNLGFPTWSSVFNWGRATVGTVPFVWLGATQFGPEGVIAGQAAGAVVFGIASIIVAVRVVDQLAAHHISGQRDTTPEVAPPIPPFSSGKAATALDWADPEERSKYEKRPPGGPGGREVQTSEGTRRSGSGWPTGEDRPGQVNSQ